jgi:hypothetical protein
VENVKLKNPFKKPLEDDPMKQLELDGDLKRNIRESLVYALLTANIPLWKCRLIVSEFYNSLNRKALLFSYECDEEIWRAIAQLEDMVG